MAQNACNDFKAPPANSKIDKPACSCTHCDVKNDSEKRQDLTCSCEDCTEAKTCLYYTKRSDGISDKKSDACCAQSNPPGNTPTIKGFIGTNLCQLYNKFKSTTWPTTPSAASETKPEKECVLEICSCFGDQTYGIMTETLRKQESIVGIQKRAYLPENYLSETKPKKERVLEKCSCIGDQTYGIMTATLHKQESIVGIQKRAYLPENYLSETKPKKERVLEKCSCIGDQTYGIMTATLHKQESIVGIQKRAYLPENYLSETKPKKERVLKKCSCIGDQTYGIMTATLHKQESIVGIQKRAYLPENYLSETKPKKERVLEKCSCIGDQTYGIMTATLHKQESIVGIQKRAYLPENYLSESKPKKECILEKCSCIGDQTYGIMTATLHKQESIVGIQKRAYLPENYLSESKPKKECILEKCSCIGDQTYGIMTATLHKQESIVGIQKRAYLAQNNLSETKSNKGCALEKCTCMMHSDSCCPVQNKDQKESPNHCGASFDSEVLKIYHMQELPDYLNGAAGYVFDVPKICCHKEESSEVPKICCRKHESSEVPKSCHKQESSEVPKSCYKQESSEVPKICYHKQDSSKVPKSSHKQELSEVPNICCLKQETSEVPKNCHKQESSDLMKGAAGYVYDIPKICCNKQNSPNPLNGAAGYVIELPKIGKDQRQCCKENRIEKHKKITTSKCNMCNASETSSSSETKTARLGSENGTQVFNINKLGSKRTISDTMHICCKTENVSDSQQYKPTKNAQGLFKNIIQTQENVLNIENTLYELPTYSPTTQKKSCDCRESDKNKSALQNILESSGCVTELQTCKTSSHETANKIGINRLKAKGIASDLKHKLVKKRNCVTPGYVWVVPKHSTKHYDHKNQKCDCKVSAKYKSHKPGYGLEQKNKINSCAFTEPDKRNPKLTEFAYDIPNCREIDNAERVWKNKKSSDCKCKKKSENDPSSSPYAHELLKCTHYIPLQKSSCVCRESANNKSASPEDAQELTKCKHKIPSQKSSCVCRESANNKSASPEDAQDLTKCTHKIPSQKSSCVCRQSAKNKSASPEDVQELAKCTHKPQSQKTSSECPESVSKAGKIQSGSSGYVFVVPKETKKSCDTKSAKNDSKSLHEANNAEVFSINRLESKYIQPDTQSICCKSMVGTQTNTIEYFASLDIPHPASKRTIDLCNDLLKNQAYTIEVLKKIYLPQKSKVVSTCCSPHLTELSAAIKKYKNSATQPRSANLSAEVLVHIPEAEFNGCLTCRQSNMDIYKKKNSISDIIKRLKEAYKACSCKICDCFSSTKSVKTDASKPYECDICLRSISSLETNKQPLCSCKPCDCVQCTKNVIEQCHCDPCECGDCKTRSLNKGQSFVVAPVITEENAPRIACTCSPCACIECGLVYPLTSSIANEMSTSTNRHALCRCEICLNESCDQSGFDSCKCQKHKVMSKPVEHDTDEFDIRTARIVHNAPMFERVGRSDTTAMFTAIPGRYPTFNKRLSNTQACSCNECECIFCVCQKDSITAIKSSQLFSSNKTKSKSDFNDRYNNHELKMPYECHINKKIQIQDTRCDCDTCDCINYETSNVPENPHRFERRRYSDDPYERCSKKEKLERVMHRFKKGDVLTPSTHRLKVQNLILQKQHLEEPSCSIPKVTTNTDSSCKLRDVDIFNELTFEFNTSNRKIGSITQANINMNDFNTKYIPKCKTFKCDAFMQERNKRISLNKNIAIDNETGSCFSEHLPSYYKRYGSNTVFLRNKSRERSSCSGYYYPEYFIQFPKGTAESSVKGDVLKLDTEETIKLDKCNIIQKSTEKNNVNKVSYDNMVGNGNSCMINECNNFSNNKLKAGPTESNNNNSENAHIASMRRNCKNGLQIQLNNQNDKHTNFGNNILQKRERNELQNSVCLRSSQSSLKMNNENREYMNAIHDFNEFYVARNVFYNIAEGNTSKHLFPIHDKIYTSKCLKQTTHSNLDGAEILNVYDYRRVRNSLMEAKKLSLELIRLLKTYEKANNEFESISEKLKLTHPI